MTIRMPALIKTPGFREFKRPMWKVVLGTGGSGTKQWKEAGTLTSIGNVLLQPAPLNPANITPAGTEDMDDWMGHTESTAISLDEGDTLADGTTSEAQRFVINKAQNFSSFYELGLREVGTG